MGATVKCISGPDGVQDEKFKNFGSDLQAIGFTFNLRSDVWRVGPKRKGILKMYTALFRILPEDCTDENKVIKVQRKTLLKIASLLSWYAQVLWAGKKTSSIQCIRMPDGVGIMPGLN